MTFGLIFNDEIKIIVDYFDRSSEFLEFYGTLDGNDESLLKFIKFVDDNNVEDIINVQIIGDKEGFFKNGRLGEVTFNQRHDGKVFFEGIVEIRY